MNYIEESNMQVTRRRGGKGRRRKRGTAGAYNSRGILMLRTVRQLQWKPSLLIQSNTRNDIFSGYGDASHSFSHHTLDVCSELCKVPNSPEIGTNIVY